MGQILLNIQAIAIIVFMVSNLLDVGLTLELADALAALRNLRFVLIALVWCFVVGPALAVLLTRIIPLAEPYALGLVLLGMAPCSPAIPMMVKNAGGKMAYLSAFILVAYAGTVVLMPLMTPWLAKGFAADPSTIGKPLLLFIALPLVVGALIRAVAPSLAGTFASIVKVLANLNNIVLLGVLLWLHTNEIVSAVGTYAIGSQVLYYALMGAGSYLLAFPLPYEQRVPLTLGVCTRNVGPALAPLMAVAGAPAGAITMCILAAFLGAVLSGFAGSAILRRFCAPRAAPTDAQAQAGI